MADSMAGVAGAENTKRPWGTESKVPLKTKQNTKKDEGMPKGRRSKSERAPNVQKWSNLSN